MIIIEKNYSSNNPQTLLTEFSYYPYLFCHHLLHHMIASDLTFHYYCNYFRITNNLLTYDGFYIQTPSEQRSNNENKHTIGTEAKKRKRKKNVNQTINLFFRINDESRYTNSFNHTIQHSYSNNRSIVESCDRILIYELPLEEEKIIDNYLLLCKRESIEGTKPFAFLKEMKWVQRQGDGIQDPIFYVCSV